VQNQDAQNREAGDAKIGVAAHKSSNYCRENCGGCGGKCADCKEGFDKKIQSLPFERFRLGLRVCNICAAILILVCVLLGLISLGMDSYSSFMLTVFVAIGGVILMLLESTCCCKGMDGRIRRTLPFIFFARGRSWVIVVLAVLSFGLGLVPILIAVFCLLPYDYWAGI